MKKKPSTSINVTAKVKQTLFAPVRWFEKTACIIGTAVLALILIVLIAVGGFFYSLPNIDEMSFEHIKQLTEAKVKSRLKDPNNYFRWTALKDVNRDYLYTIVMAEDSTFFTHQGINYDSLVESFVKNFKSGEYKYGASTITQQVVKNIFLSNTKSLFRKAKEFVITKQLEARFSKNQILELYFNVAEFGLDVYGIRAASYRIFDKSPLDINAAEGAFIATLLPSPKRYYYAMVQNQNISPSNQRKIIRVLKDMRYNEFISYEQFLEYQKYRYF